MSDKLSLPLASFFSVSESGRGLIYPLFRGDFGNVPFVQIVDRDGRVDTFVPLFETEGLKFFPTNVELEVSVGDSAVVAIEINGSIVWDTIDGFRRQVALGSIDLADPALPVLTRLGISRLIETTVNNRTTLLAEYLEGTAVPKSAIVRFQASEARAQMNLKSWWKVIEEAEAVGPKEIPASLADLDIEEIFLWLIDNEIDETWKKLFLSIISKVMFDSRVNTLLSMFISEFEDLFEYDKTSKILLSRGIELFLAFGYFDQEFFDHNVLEFLYDKVISGQIFVLAEVIDPSSLVEFLRRLPDALPDYDKSVIIESILDYLEESVAPPRLSEMLFDYIWYHGELDYRYPEEYSYVGTRFDRLFESYLHNDLFRSRLPKNLSEQFRRHKREIENRISGMK